MHGKWRSVGYERFTSTPHMTVFVLFHPMSGRVRSTKKVVKEVEMDLVWDSGGGSDWKLSKYQLKR